MEPVLFSRLCMDRVYISIHHWATVLGSLHVFCWQASRPQRHEFILITGCLSPPPGRRDSYSTWSNTVMYLLHMGPSPGARFGVAWIRGGVAVGDPCVNGNCQGQFTSRTIPCPYHSHSHGHTPQATLAAVWGTAASRYTLQWRPPGPVPAFFSGIKSISFPLPRISGQLLSSCISSSICSTAANSR